MRHATLFSMRQNAFWDEKHQIPVITSDATSHLAFKIRGSLRKTTSDCFSGHLLLNNGVFLNSQTPAFRSWSIHSVPVHLCECGMKLASRLLLATLASLAYQPKNKQHNFTLYLTHCKTMQCIIGVWNKLAM